MKKYFLLIFILLVTTAYSQISVTSADMPSAGDTSRMSIAANAFLYDFSETGADYSWDFSGLLPVSQRLDSMVNPLETPALYQLFFIPFIVANLASPLSGLPVIPGFELKDMYRFYKNDQSSFKDVGFAATLAGIPLPVKYAQPDIIYHFPLEYQNEDSSYAYYEFEVPGFAYAEGYKERKYVVDGWGNLTTPYGSFNTVRIKAQIRQFDSLYLDTLNSGLPVYLDYIEYKWLAADMGAPLLEVYKDGPLVNAVYRDSIRNNFMAVEEQTLSDKVKIFPNPARQSVNMHFSLCESAMIEVSIHDMKGRKLFVLMQDRLPAGDQSIRRELPDDMPAGIYLISFKSGINVWSHKLIIE